MPLLRGSSVPTVLQLEAAECGAASLAMVLGYWGKHVTLEHLRALCGVSRDGAKASSLVRAARSYGLDAKGLKAEPEHLIGTKGPAIAFINFNHFVVVEKVTPSWVWINDPAAGRRRMSMNDFSEAFTGVVLTFSPTDSFERGDSRPSVKRALWSRLDGFKLALFFVFLVNLALIIPGIAVPVFSRIFVDFVLVRGFEDWLIPLLIGMLLTALARFILLQIQGFTLSKVAENLKLKTGEKLFWRFLRLPAGFFEQRFIGEIADRVNLNEQVADLLTGKLAAALIAVVTSVFFAVAMFVFQPTLASVVVLLSLLNIVALWVTSKAMSEKLRKVSIDNGKLQGARIADLKDIETFKASGGENVVFDRWSALATDIINGRQQTGKISAWITPVPVLISSLVQLTVLVGGGILVTRGEMTLGTVVAFQSLSASFSAPIASLAGFGAEMQALKSYTHRLQDVEDQKLDKRFRTPARALDALPVGKVELSDVSFGYAPLDPPLVSNLNLSIPAGARVALVGSSGSGKSTVGKLIAGLLIPHQGDVRIDGTAPEEWQRNALAQRMAYVDQESLLFRGTIRENLTLWNDRVDEQAIVNAAKDACAHDLIARRAGGYDAMVAEAGANFSGGEKQRIEIARALSSDPAMIVLDEATSALDPITEKRVMDAIRRRGTTAIIIAHRLSTVRDCDEIVVLQGGRPVERGAHLDLLRRGGEYARLVST